MAVDPAPVGYDLFMRRRSPVPRLLWLLLLLAGAPRGVRAEVPVEARTWMYGQYLLVSESGWGFTVMPGFRHELADSAESPSGLSMMELFTGPFYTWNWGDLKVTLPLWYYFMGFPAGDDPYRSHNVELIPILRHPLGDTVSVQSRTIFHNKVYASNPVFTEASQRWGHSLLLREMLTVDWSPAILDGWTLTASEEVFVGVLEDGETRDLARGEPFFARRGFSMNRVYAGVKHTWPLPGARASLALVPQYVLETHHDPEHDPEQGASLTRIRHYGFLSLRLVHVLPSTDGADAASP